MAHIDAALFVDLHDLDLKLVADLHHVLHLLHTPLCELRNMAEAFLAGQDLNKSTEFHKAGDSPCIDLANLNFPHDVLDHLAGFFHAFRICRSDEDIPVLMDIDIHAGLVDDLLDHLAAGTNDLTDLVHLDLNGLHTGRIG